MLSIFSKRAIAFLAKPAAVAPLATALPRFFSDAPSAGARATGTVKWFDATKGFGFIGGDDGTDVFVHFTGIKGSGYRSLQEGQKVEFTVGSSAKGKAAVDVVVA